jgi:Uma2 family endonuclease
MSTVVERGQTPQSPEEDPFRYGWRYVRETNPDGSESFKQVPLTLEDFLHPQEEDFFVQSPAHVQDCLYLKSVLDQRTAGQPGAVVTCDCRVDWGVAGIEPHGPDVAVFLGAKDWDPSKGTFYVAQLGARPVLVIEVTSPDTRLVDLDEKVEEYYRAGVPFYAIVDARVRAEGRVIRFLGYRATPEGFLRLPPDEHGRLWLESVRLWLAAEEGRVVCYDDQNKKILDYVEMAQAAQDAEQRAEAEKARAEAEKARAETEKARAEAAEARLREMEAELQRLRANKQSEGPR